MTPADHESCALDDSLLQHLDSELLFRQMPGLFVMLAPDDYRVLVVSDAYLEATGMTRERMLGIPFHQVFPDDPENPQASGTANLLRSLQHVKTRLQTDVMAVQKHPIRNPRSGALEDRYWTPVNAPVLDREGRLRCIIHRSEDVTAYVLGQDASVTGAALVDARRQEAEIVQRSQDLQRLNERLRASEERMKAIFRDASLGMGVADLNGNLIEANAAYCRMVGYSIDELKHMNFVDITHPEDQSRNLELHDLMKEGDQNKFVYEKRYITKQGETIWCRLVGSPLRDAGGRVTNLIALVEDITLQKQAEQRLRQQETLARLGGKIARVGGLALTLAKEGHSVYWSREVFDIFDYEGDLPPSRDALIERIQPPYGWLYENALSACEYEGRPFDLEIEAHSFKGRPLWLRIACEAERDETDAIVRIVGAVQDITRQKANQKERQQMSNRLFATLESMHDAFYLVDDDWNLLYLNSQAERILHVRREDVVGKNFWARFPALKSSMLYDAFQKAMRNLQPFQGEYYWPQGDLWLEVKAFPSNDGLAVYFQSVSEQKKLQREIIESEQRLKYVTEATLDVAWDWQLESGDLWWSDGLQRHFGYDPREADAGIDFWLSLLHPDDRERVWANFQDSIAGEVSTIAQRYRLQRRDGRYAHVEDRCFVIRDEQGKARRLVGGMSDVTEREELEEQLRQSQRLRSIGQLTGGVAHDFNNLLTVILGNSELLMEELGQRSPLYGLTQMIAGAAQRGADLTRHLLAFARRQALEPRVVDINQLMLSMEPLLRRTLGEQVEVRIFPGEGLGSALVDPQQLESAVLNLCINARDAMPDGGLLSIETLNVDLDAHYSAHHAEVKPGSYVALVVSDTGVGIPPEILEHVFEPFFTTKEKGKGTGLGLSTVFGFVKQSNGHVNIYSEPGQGTTVKIYLPRVQANADALREPEKVVSLGGSEIVLLVEDDDMVREYAWQQLSLLGYNVIVASSGEEALEVLRDRPDIDLLFTDVIMTGMGGRELAERARELRPELKVLFTSGYTQNSIVHNGRLDEGVHLLGKPYQRSQLAAKIREVLEEDDAAR